MEFDRLDFPAAVKSLSESVGLKVPTEENADQTSNRRKIDYTKILEEANLFYKTNLRQHPKNKKQLTYLKRRRVTGELREILD